MHHLLMVLLCSLSILKLPFTTPMRMVEILAGPVLYSQFHCEVSFKHSSIIITRTGNLEKKGLCSVCLIREGDLLNICLSSLDLEAR